MVIELNVQHEPEGAAVWASRTAPLPRWAAVRVQAFLREALAEAEAAAPGCLARDLTVNMFLQGALVEAGDLPDAAEEAAALLGAGGSPGLAPADRGRMEAELAAAQAGEWARERGGAAAALAELALHGCGGLSDLSDGELADAHAAALGGAGAPPPAQPRPPKGAPAEWAPESVDSPSRARRFLAWAAVIELGGVNPAFHPEDDFADARWSGGGPVWDGESAARLNACMEAAFAVLGGDGVFEALRAIYEACGYEEGGEPTA